MFLMKAVAAAHVLHLLAPAHCAAQQPAAPVVRDPCLWPFAQNSIWNTPIGSAAVYVPARIAPATAFGMTYDPDFIIMTPTAPLVTVYQNLVGFDEGDRCPIQGPALFQAPIPADFLVPSDSGNACMAVLMPDGRTVRQVQPFARCTVGAFGTALYEADPNDLFTDGVLGPHGGSAMTALGGTLRVGELRPGKHPPRHVLKGNVYAARNLFRCTQDEDCFRWPAERADGYAVGEYGTLRNDIPVAMRMGALLALAPSIDINSLGLQTEPARQLAWSLQNYGMYIVDDTYWEVYALAIEEGPGRSFAAQFLNDYGFDFEDTTTTSPWASDMRTLFASLSVIDNNAPDAVGGGGVPRVAPAPPLAPQCGVGIGSSDPVVPAVCPADVNDDGVVNFDDMTTVLANFGATTGPFGLGDANGSGTVNFDDMTTVLANFGLACP